MKSKDILVHLHAVQNIERKNVKIFVYTKSEKYVELLDAKRNGRKRNKYYKK